MVGDTENNGKRPSLKYKGVIIKGALEHGMPQTYLDHLEAFADNGFNGHVDLKSCVGTSETLESGASYATGPKCPSTSGGASLRPGL